MRMPSFCICLIENPAFRLEPPPQVRFCDVAGIPTDPAESVVFKRPQSRAKSHRVARQHLLDS